MRIIGLFTLLLICTTACHTTRRSVPTPPSADTFAVPAPVDTGREDSLARDSVRRVGLLLARVDSNRLTFETFAAKVKVDYKDSKDKTLDFNAFIRMRRDSVVWVSIIAALGVEAFRVLIRPDSVMILDKLEKTIQVTTVNDLQRITGLPFDFITLQQLIIGNPLFMQGAVESFREDPEGASMLISGDRFRHQLRLSKPDTLIRSSRLDDADLLRKRTAQLEYDGYAVTSGRLFSVNRKIRLTERETIDLHMEFRQVEFDGPQSFPFSIPKNYKLK